MTLDEFKKMSALAKVAQTSGKVDLVVPAQKIVAPQASIKPLEKSGRGAPAPAIPRPAAKMFEPKNKLLLEKSEDRTEPVGFTKEDSASLLEEAPLKAAQRPFTAVASGPRPTAPALAARPADKPYHSETAPQPLPRSNVPPPFKLSSSAVAKPVMHDIMYKAVAMGPVEEIQAVTLTDFRRLSQNPAEAAERLRQKFLNLKEDSILFYLDGLAAWRKSPLFQDYVSSVTESLASGQKLTAVLGDKNKIQLLELAAVVAMNKSL